MKFALAILGVTLLFFFGSSASADSISSDKTESASPQAFAYAVYCDAAVDRTVYQDQMVERSGGDDDIMVLTTNGYQKLMQSLSADYETHCGPGVRVSVKGEML